MTKVAAKTTNFIAFTIIVPKKLKNSDFSKFDPDLGFLLKVLKLGEKGVSKMISEPQYQSVDGETALGERNWKTWVGDCSRRRR